MNLQDVVDELAETLDRSIVINDPGYKPIVASAQGDDIDEVRARSLLQRRTPPRERDYLESIRVHQSRRPVTVNLDHLGHLERLAIPIWHEDALLGVLWLIIANRPPLNTDDFRALDAAVDMARGMLADRDGGGVGSARGTVLRGLLSADPIVRRDALIAASRTSGLERGPATAVRALAVGHDTGPVQRATLGRAIDVGSGGRLSFLREEGSTLLFLGRSDDGAADDERLEAETKRQGVKLRSIGSARMTRADTDLRPVADRAIAAAGLAEVLPELAGRADADEVGPWMMIADVVADPARLPAYSPAAHVLLTDADRVRRQTVEAFLDGAGHVRDVCEKLHIHRTTLYYRLENMPQVVRDALDTGLSRSVLHVTLKLASYWEHSGRL
ncbi:helix-turn-helix domain-containing protein [Microbacterium sp. P05]|uniref:helix-turn-helix domain-containing protein n=1 Tax=Microbacterium sp. P05 TaxID=3366948 RepID=UPI0037457DE3